jgi:four helix bundle protein
MKLIKRHTELDVYKLSFQTAMDIFRISKSFPKEEKYSLTDQIRRSSRAVSANISEAFRKRRYIKSFVLKLNDSEAEAAETQTWLEFARECNYISQEDFENFYKKYDQILGKLVNMINDSGKWSM